MPFDQSAPIVHCGGWKSSLEEIRDLPKPEPLGRRHFPRPHAEVIDRMIGGLQDFGLKPNLEKARWALAHEGAQCFGVLPVTNGLQTGDDWGFMFGLRLSTDRSLAAGILAGDNVFVCDNLAFRAEVKAQHKYTRFMRDHIGGRLQDMLAEWYKIAQVLKGDIDWLKGREITVQERDHALIRLVRCDIVNPTQIPRILEECDAPKHAEFKEPTAWAFRNNVTEILKELSANNLMTRTQRLNTVIKHALGERAEFACV